MIKVKISYVNGSWNERAYQNYSEAKEYCQRGISYSGGRVQRVEIDNQAIWDLDWDALSQHAGLYR